MTTTIIFRHPTLFCLHPKLQVECDAMRYSCVTLLLSSRTTITCYHLTLPAEETTLVVQPATSWHSTTFNSLMMQDSSPDHETIQLSTLVLPLYLVLLSLSRGGEYTMHALIRRWFSGFPTAILEKLLVLELEYLDVEGTAALDHFFLIVTAKPPS